jgi:hypothetical protein
VLIKLLPDGFEPLLAPAAALPAVLVPLLVEVPVVVPLVEAPVVAPDVADPPVAGLLPAEPPLWANAKELASASAAARVMVMNLMEFPILLPTKHKRRRLSLRSLCS